MGTPEDAGSIYSEVRIRLDKLQADITQAVSSIDRFGSTVVDMSNTVSNLFSNNYSKSIQNVKTYLSSLDGAVKSGAMTQKQAIEESIAVRKQELAYIQATAAKKGGYTTQEMADMKLVRSELGRLETQYKELYAAEDKAGKGATSFSAASVAAAAVVALAFRSLVTATSDYSAALAGVRAATRASTEEMDQFAAAADAAAKQYGKTNAEALQGIEALAKAGVSTADILGGGLQGAMALAAAGELAVGDAAEIAASAMTQFGLDGTKVTHIADLLAAGAGKAQGEVTDLAQGLKYVGPVAAGMNVSIEKVVGTLALLASNGIMADQAGSGLRGVLSAMTAPSKIAREEMERLGISVYDSAGNFKGLSNLGGELSRTLSGATDAQRDMSLGMIFGNEQITVARTLLKGGAEAIDEWTAKVDDAGFASETAAIKLDSLDGDLKKLDASTKNVAASLGTAGEPALRGFAQAATGVLNVISDLPGPAKVALITIAGLTGGIIALTAAAPALVFAIKAVGAAIGATPFGIAATAVGILAVGLTTAAASAGAFESSTDRIIRNSKDLQEETRKNNEAFTKIVGPTNSATAANKLSADQIEQLKKLYPELTKTMDLNKATIGQVTEAQKKLNAERNKDAISAINAEIKANTDLMASNSKALADNQKATSSLTDASIKSREKAIKAYDDYIAAGKTATAQQTKAYEKNKAELADLKKGTDEGNKARQDSITWTNQQNAKIEEQNRRLRAQRDELDGTKDAEIAKAAAEKQAAAEKASAALLAKQAIEREMQGRKDLITQYQKDMAVNKAMLDKKLIDEEEYLKQIVEISNARISQLQSDAKKDGAISKENEASQRAEMAIRDEASAKLAEISKAKAAAAAEEKKLQDALNGTEESMQAEIDAIDALETKSAGQIAFRDKLAKKIEAIKEKEVKDTKATQEEIRKAEEETNVFRAAMQSGTFDAINEETARNKLALQKRVDDLKAANATRLASDSGYADQSAAIAKYQADEIEKIEKDSLAKREQAVEESVKKQIGLTNQILTAFTSLFSAIGQLNDAMAQSEIDALDARYQAQVDELDRETEALLRANGERTAVEEAQAALDKAIADQKMQDELAAIDVVAQAKKEARDAETQAMLEALDAETQAKLEAIGIFTLTATEAAQAKLDEAIAIGDAELIAEAEKELAKTKILEDAAARKKEIEDAAAVAEKLAAETAAAEKKAIEEAKAEEDKIALAKQELEKQKILEAADAKKLAAETAYNKKKAKMEYDAALVAWDLQVISSIAAGAMAVLNAITSGWVFGPVVAASFGVAAGVASGIQIAAVAAAKPKPPALATGGIAIPSSTGGGAEVLVAENGSPELMLNGGASGEAFLNQFADKVAARIMSGKSGSNITIVNELDSVVISRAVARNFDNGTVRVKGLA